MARWNNFVEMVGDVHRHVRATGRPVMLDESPMDRTLGFKNKDGSESWTISLVDLKRSLFEVKDVTDDIHIMRKCASTPDGRLHLANYVLES